MHIFSVLFVCGVILSLFAMYPYSSQQTEAINDLYYGLLECKSQNETLSLSSLSKLFIAECEDLNFIDIVYLAALQEQEFNINPNKLWLSMNRTCWSEYYEHPAPIITISAPNYRYNNIEPISPENMYQFEIN